MAGAFSLMGDHVRADDAFHMAIDNLAMHDWPVWWFDWSYGSRLRDAAGLIAVAAETGQADTVKILLDRFSAISHDATQLNTQEQASLLSAAHALNKGMGELNFAVNGTAVKTGSTPSFSPSSGDIAAGYSVTNQSSHALWRTLAVTGSPREASPALEAGYSIEKSYFTLKGKKLDPARMQQNDRVIVEVHGFVTGDDASHRTVIVDMLPAGWEIEAPIANDTDYAFSARSPRPVCVRRVTTGSWPRWISVAICASSAITSRKTTTTTRSRNWGTRSSAWPMSHGR